METLTTEQGRKLIKLARIAIGNRLCDRDNTLQPKTADPLLLKNRGTFVTLKLNDQLRGCIGNIEPVKTIRDGIHDNAVSAAFSDYRFSPLSKEEFGNVHISISILSEAKRLVYDDDKDLVKKLRPFQDGVILRKDGRSATFLPQVWEQLPDVDQFLSQLCLKAGVLAGCWRDADVEILVYQVQSFQEGSK